MTRRTVSYNGKAIARVEVPMEHADCALDRIRPVINECLKNGYFFEDRFREMVLSIYQQGLLDGVEMATRHPEKLGILPEAMFGP